VARRSPYFSIFVPTAYYYQKNLEFVPHVASSLKAQGIDRFEFVLTLPTNSVGWRRIAQFADKLRVATHIRTVGSVPHADLTQHYAASDAVFLPSLMECSTAVYPEAFVAAVPLCTSDRDFARVLCEDAAVYVDPFDATQAATELRRLMSDVELRAKLVEAGRRVLRSNYCTPEEKWHAQRSFLHQVAASRLGT